MSYRRRSFIAAFIVLLSLSVGYLLFMEEQGNFHSITDGEAYRSAQLDRDELQYYLKKYHIRSILNLRGSNPEASWYRQEIKISDEQKVMHFDIRLSASSAPKKEDLREMIRIFRSAPRPILMHCQAGADRSGLAAAIWKVIIDGRPKKEAEKQLSLFYGHMPIGPTTVLDRFFESWDAASK
jgi:protein tyrosine/serine phosphatase